MSAAERFSLTSAAARIETVGRHVAVFNAESFETHLVNEAAGALLHAIAEAPRTEDELAALLSELLRADACVDARAHARDALARLQAVGLVDTVSPS